MAEEKKRLDLLLVERNFYPTREKAQAAIMAGLIMVGEQKVEKAGTKVEVQLPIRILGDLCPYVSRGGLKLAKALAVFPINLENKIILDIGASTGGFTDCALQNGARKVYAIDVGYGQLAWSLRQDPRVVNLERTNIRHLTLERLGEKGDLATIDVSFISLSKVLATVKDLLVEQGEIITLVKPQFEAGKENIGKRGVVKDSKIHRQVLNKVIKIAQEIGLVVRGLTFSPIKGPEGNIEFLLLLSKDLTIEGVGNLTELVEKTIEESKQLTNN